MSGTYFNWLSFGIALLGVVLSSIAIVWNIMRERRKVRIVFLGDIILLINHTRRIINIENVGFILPDKIFWIPMLTELGESISVPAEDQLRIEIGKISKGLKPKYIFADDVLGKQYKTKISKNDIEFYGL